MENQIATRRLRIIKYRGSRHGTNEYPFLIEEDGISVLPITSLGLKHEASEERISTGIERLDTMLGGKGYYRGTTILISGTAGTGKTSFAAEFARAACEQRRALPVLRIRGVTKPDNQEYEIYRHRPPALYRYRSYANQCLTANGLRSGDASDSHAQAHR